MTMPEERLTKMIFEVDVDDGVEIETMWVEPEGGGYRIKNIPFYATSLAFDDLVRASTDPDGMLRFEELISASGHSTLRIVLHDPAARASVLKVLRELGCGAEGADIECLIAIDVPPETSWRAVTAHLAQLRQDGILDYEEACIAHSTATPPS
jgi:hypothetical protein